MGACLVLGWVSGAAADEPVGDPQKPWHLYLSLREEYDDNVNTAPNKTKEGSFNTIVIPSADLSLPLQNTHVAAAYSYELKYYENPPPNDNRLDHTHTLDLGLHHSFGERTSLEWTNILVRAAEPEAALVDRQGVPVVDRREGDYWNQKTDLRLRHRLSGRWSVGLGGFWSLWRYDEEDVDVKKDRDTYNLRGSTYFDVDERTMVGFNQQFQSTRYVWPRGSDGSPFKLAESRNSMSHISTLSLRRSLRPTLTLRVEGGVEVRDLAAGTSEVSPRVEMNLGWNYLPKGTLNFIGSYLLSDSSEDDYRISQSASARIRLSHPLTARLRGLLDASYTHDRFEEPDSSVKPAASDLDKQTVRARAELEYQLRRWCFLQAGYTFTKLISDVRADEFERNRGYVGVRLAY